MLYHNLFLDTLIYCLTLDGNIQRTPVIAYAGFVYHKIKHFLKTLVYDYLTTLRHYSMRKTLKR